MTTHTGGLNRVIETGTNPIKTRWVTNVTSLGRARYDPDPYDHLADLGLVRPERAWPDLV